MPNNEWGDFQTPLELARQVVDVLPERKWARVLEPTCGRGSFLVATAALEAERVGIEIQADHANEALQTGAEVLAANVFDLHLGVDVPWTSSGALLVIGNPPWVTNAELGTLGSINLPRKSNIKGLRGIDAITGSSNFDIAEFIILKLIIELADDRPTIAMLCKTQVARNVLDYCQRAGVPLENSQIRRVDAKRWFGASVDACLFVTSVADRATTWDAMVFAELGAAVAERRIGFAKGRLIADLDAYQRSSFADGNSPIEWRQGVKHDAAEVMELRLVAPGSYERRDGSHVDLEPDWVYPLMKATDVHHDRSDANRVVVVSQRSLISGTEQLADSAPRLWQYLSENARVLDGRKSSIYRGRPRFAMFGIGDYTFAPWKVAVSGLHAQANFRLLGPRSKQPVLLDDTCYLLAFDDGSSAAIALALLRSPATADLLAALVFSDAKRPITKKLLQRIDLAAIAKSMDPQEICDAATTALGEPVSRNELESFSARYFASTQLDLSA